MRRAKDGQLFDVEYVTTDTSPNEVEVIQFLRPSGKRRRMLCAVGGKFADMAEDMILSGEELRTGEIVLYARFIDEDKEKEISEIAINGPGEHSPTECLKRLIEKKFKQRSKE